jgi:hypothetical protein
MTNKYDALQKIGMNSPHFVRISKRKRSLARPKRRSDDNIKIAYMPEYLVVNMEII